MTEELIRVGNPDLLWIRLTLAAKVLITDEDLEWLRRRKTMLSDFLVDSPLYQETIVDAEIGPGLSEQDVRVMLELSLNAS